MPVKTAYIITCQDNPDTVFGVADSSKEAASIIDTVVDAARDALDKARYEHVLENELDPLDSLDVSEYADTGLIRQTVAENYTVTEIPVNTPAETSIAATAPMQDEDAN